MARCQRPLVGELNLEIEGPIVSEGSTKGVLTVISRVAGDGQLEGAGVANALGAAHAGVTDGSEGDLFGFVAELADIFNEADHVEIVGSEGRSGVSCDRGSDADLGLGGCKNFHGSVFLK